VVDVESPVRNTVLSSWVEPHLKVIIGLLETDEKDAKADVQSQGAPKHGA
jgi:hypothetical protein